jgi:hypothetical protein
MRIEKKKRLEIYIYQEQKYLNSNLFKIQIAILIMDTQGLFEIESTPIIDQTIFYLSMLISSIQILNLKEKLDSNNFHCIKLFCEMTKSFLDTSESKPFQVN